MTRPTDYHEYDLPEPFDIDSINKWGGQLNDVFNEIDTDVILRGTLNERPTAESAGRLYMIPSSRQLFIDDGDNWRRLGAQTRITDNESLIATSPQTIDFDSDITVSNPSTGTVRITPSGFVSTSGDTMTGPLKMEADITDSNDNPIWDDSEGFVPQTILENDDVTISGGTGIIGGATTLGGSISVSVDEADNFSWSGSHDFSDTITVPAPQNDDDAARKGYVDSVAEGLGLRESVRAATDGTSVDLASATDPNPIDGVTLSDGDRVLLKDQTDETDNGIYVATTGTDPTTWERSPDADEDSEVVSGMFVFIEEGTNNLNEGWIVVTPDPITLGTTEIDWTQFSGAGQITDGSGISKSGDTLNFDPSTGLEIDGGDQAALDEDYSVSWTSDQTFESDIIDGASNLIYDQSSNYVPAARIEQGSGSGLDADTVDGYEGSDLVGSKNVAQLSSTDTATDINQTSWTDIEFDVQDKVDSAFTHDATNSPEELTFDEAGTYRITVSLSYDNNGNPDVNPGIKFNINGTRYDTFGLTGYVSDTAGHEEGSNTVERVIDVSSGDTLKIQTLQTAGSGTVTLRSDESVLIAEQLSETVGFEGDADTLDGLDSTAFVKTDGSSVMDGTLGVNQATDELFSRFTNTSSNDELRIGTDTNGHPQLAGYDDSTTSETTDITLDTDTGTTVVSGGFESVDSASFSAPVSLTDNLSIATGQAIEDDDGDAINFSGSGQINVAGNLQLSGSGARIEDSNGDRRYVPDFGNLYIPDAGASIRFYDEVDGNDVLRANQGGNVEIPNGDLQMGGNKISDYKQMDTAVLDNDEVISISADLGSNELKYETWDSDGNWLRNLMSIASTGEFTFYNDATFEYDVTASSLSAGDELSGPTASEGDIVTVEDNPDVVPIYFDADTGQPLVPDLEDEQ